MRKVVAVLAVVAALMGVGAMSAQAMPHDEAGAKAVTNNWIAEQCAHGSTNCAFKISGDCTRPFPEEEQWDCPIATDPKKLFSNVTTWWESNVRWMPYALYHKVGVSGKYKYFKEGWRTHREYLPINTP